MLDRYFVLRLFVLLINLRFPALASADCMDTIDIGLIQRMPNSIYIDTRDLQSFADYRISGSINVSSNEIKLKKIWHKRPLYLIGYGYDEYSMLELCRQMQLSGFEDVSVIKNGVLAEAIGSGPVEDTIYYISVQALVSVLNAHQGVLLDISGGRVVSSLGLNGVHYVSAENLSAFIRAAQKSRSISHLPVFIITADTSQYKALHVLNHNSDNPVYFVDGGVEALKEYIEYIENVRRKAKFELQEVKACGE